MEDMNLMDEIQCEELYNDSLLDDWEDEDEDFSRNDEPDFSDFFPDETDPHDDFDFDDTI